MKFIAYCFSCNKEHEVADLMSGSNEGLKCECGGYIITPSGNVKFKPIRENEEDSKLLFDIDENLPFKEISEEIISMPTGERLDWLVATKVFGLKEGVDFGKFSEHNWKKDEYGDIDYFATEYDYCNGPSCERCHYGYCRHCYPDGGNEPCEVHVKKYSTFGHMKGIEDILDKVGGLGNNVVNYNGQVWSIYSNKDIPCFSASTFAELACKYALLIVYKESKTE